MLNYEERLVSSARIGREISYNLVLRKSYQDREGDRLVSAWIRREISYNLVFG